VSYRTLDAAQIVTTLRLLEQRIAQRFPDLRPFEGLPRASPAFGEEAQQRARGDRHPQHGVAGYRRCRHRGGVWPGSWSWRWVVTQLIHLQVGSEVFGLFQGIDAAMNITVLTGRGAVLRDYHRGIGSKRRRSLRDLHVFRNHRAR